MGAAGRYMKHRIEELARLQTEARRLAHSGAYSHFAEVRRELIARGHADAWKIFKNPWTRSEIDRLCDLARRMEHPDSRQNVPF